MYRNCYCYLIDCPIAVTVSHSCYYVAIYSRCYYCCVTFTVAMLHIMFHLHEAVLLLCTVAVTIAMYNLLLPGRYYFLM
jgi:hypothetical protein